MVSMKVWRRNGTCMEKKWWMIAYLVSAVYKNEVLNDRPGIGVR
jgi:hypothetical protein